ncbi:High mobility group protein 20A [Xenoophorus captivus]|uniref:High mobility group protein 20A n=1 Tax=Xenoophorus captivus TaxID=1517983 RepID=A0ABV0RK98_9TELE
MRQLRKTNMEYEERNAALQKHVESMRGAVERLEGDVMQERERNRLLHQHLETLRQALTSSLSSVPLPGARQSHQHSERCSQPLGQDFLMHITVLYFVLLVRIADSLGFYCLE